MDEKPNKMILDPRLIVNMPRLKRNTSMVITIIATIFWICLFYHIYNTAQNSNEVEDQALRNPIIKAQTQEMLSSIVKDLLYVCNYYISNQQLPKLIPEDPGTTNINLLFSPALYKKLKNNHNYAGNFCNNIVIKKYTATENSDTETYYLPLITNQYLKIGDAEFSRTIKNMPGVGKVPVATDYTVILGIVNKLPKIKHKNILSLSKINIL